MDFNTFVMKKMEEKLIELMGKDAYAEFATEIAREGFRMEVNGMADGEFKYFCQEYFDDITK